MSEPERSEQIDMSPIFFQLQYHLGLDLDQIMKLTLAQIAVILKSSRTMSESHPKVFARTSGRGIAAGTAQKPARATVETTTGELLEVCNVCPVPIEPDTTIVLKQIDGTWYVVQAVC
jgi:hypothetical protein